jgi:hypothetical protein
MSKAEKEIIKVARRTALEVIQEIFSDPDRGLKFTESAKRRLRKANVYRGSFVSLSTLRRSLT